MKVKVVPATLRSAAFGGTLRVGRAGGGEALTEAERTALLSEVRSNPGTTARLQLDVIGYLQPDGVPNRNRVMFSPKKLKRIAASFKGMPFLRDHAQDEVLARGGTILAAELVEHDGHPAFQMTVELTKPWAIEGALDGTIDRFSIGWSATGPVVCSISGCRAEYMDLGWFGMYPSCEHMPGDEVETKKGIEVCQIEFTEAEGVELSAVSVPAVLGTGVEEVRAALTASKRDHMAALSNRGTHMLKSLIPLLSLAATASEEDALAAVTKLQASEEGAKAALKDSQERETKLKAQLADFEAKALAGRRDSVLAKGEAEGRIAKGTRVYEHAQKLAARGDLDGLEAFLADLPPNSAGAIGEPRLSAKADPTPKGGAPGAVLATGQAGLTADENKILELTGVSPELYLREKARISGAA